MLHPNILPRPILTLPGWTSPIGALVDNPVPAALAS